MVRNLSVSFLMGLLTLGVSSNAHAGWGSWGGSHGSQGGSVGSGSWGGSSGGGSSGSFGAGYGSSGGTWGGGSSGGSFESLGGSSGGSSGGYVGPVRRLLNHLHAHHEARTAYRLSHASSGGSWGGSSGGSRIGRAWGGSSGTRWGGSSGGSSGGGSWSASSGSSWSGGSSGGGYISSGYGSSGGSSGSWVTGSEVMSSDVILGDSYEGSTTEGVPTESGIIEGAPSGSSESMELEPMTPARETRKPTNRGVLTVQVPANAKVVVNGLATSSRGENRRYVSHGLKPGHDYRYEVTASVEKDGRPITLTKTAVLQVGQTASLAFDFDSAASENVVTSLTLKVPSDAKVYLSGNETQADGSIRRFSTTKIGAGLKWEDYTVRVTLDRDGKTLTKERQVSLTGGDQRELVFDFDQTELADAR